MKPDFQKHPPLILVTDDQKTPRLMLRMAMEQEGYQVTEASNGKECLELCQQLKPDMVLLDAVMPVMDGFTCCDELHALLGEDCPPVLMITVLDDQASGDRAFEVGATDYVTKPIHWPVLCQRVRRLLHTHWAIAQLRLQIERERLLTQQLETANQELQRLAAIDGLTQIANRRCFDEYLQQEWQRAMEAQLSLSLILCDIDFFKPYNDTYGHQAGDECLKVIAKILYDVTRRSHAGMATRYGGEEFSLILPNTSALEAVAIAETIRAQVRMLSLAHIGSPISNYVTLSLGIASVIPSLEVSPELLIAEADKALYQAKQKGRNRAIFSVGITLQAPATHSSL